ncbi:hypothetical protein ACLB2K_006441 [Fragaria x ananassa]
MPRGKHSRRKTKAINDTKFVARSQLSPTIPNAQSTTTTTLALRWSPSKDHIILKKDEKEFRKLHKEYFFGDTKKHKRLPVFEEVELNMFKDVIYEEINLEGNLEPRKKLLV